MRNRLPALALCAGLAPLAYGQMPPQDTVKNGQDHPLLSRFEGAKMVGYETRNFDEIVLPAGRLGNVNARSDFVKKVPLEGRITRIAYNFPKEHTSLEVMRNYEQALAKAGLKTVFSCANKACGEGFGRWWLGARVSSKFTSGKIEYWQPFNYGAVASRYLLAQGTRPDGTVVHAAIIVASPKSGKNGGVYTEIVESAKMETGKVTASLDAAGMAKGIAAEGKVAVYGVYFDTGKADVKPDSKAALGEMARLLQQDQSLTVYIVGHTDNQGVAAHNLQLSQERAAAVAKALATDYSIDARRLEPRGVASLAPVASNDTDAGREKNRRVELVKQ